MLAHTRQALRFLTHSDLDALFVAGDRKEGLPEGHVLHLTGPPGSGKSHVCAALALETLRDHRQGEVLLIGEMFFFQPQTTFHSLKNALQIPLTLFYRLGNS